MKSVNHRFLDVQIRLPRQANAFELSIRQKVKEYIQRGRTEVFINIKEKGVGNKQVVVQWSLIDQLLAELKGGMKERSEILSENLLNDLIPTILRESDYVMVEEEQQEDAALEALIISATEQAVIALDASRSQEGNGILTVLKGYQDKFAKVVHELAAFVELYEADFRQRFETKLKAWLEDQVAEERLLTEMAILLERGDIHEELDRLDIHLKSFEKLLKAETPVGRELDFLIQEMNREVNTIGSKSSPIEIKNLVVQLKTILEKIREQIQNVE